jgi:uncharacterized protein
MQINIAQLLKSSIGTERVYQIDEFIEINDSNVKVKGDIKLIRTDRGILASARIEAEVGIECSRCLEVFHYPVKLKFEEEYFPTIDVVSGLPVETPEEQDGGFTIDRNHVIDLDDAIREYVILATPMKPLCKDDCSGLCPECGENLNKGSCHCHPGKVV